MMKVGAIVQARTSSTRLPNKVLKELPYRSGITVLEQVIRRLSKSKKLCKFEIGADAYIINRFLSMEEDLLYLISYLTKYLFTLTNEQY